MELVEGVLNATIRVSVPILLVVLGEIVAERAGVLNIGLEGMMLVGAFGGFAGAYATGSPAVGVALGVSAGVLFSALFAALVLRATLDPIVVGVALNVLALGLTGVLFRAITSDGGNLLVATLPVVALPGLAAIPALGSSLFTQNALGFVAFAAVPIVAWVLAKTSPGLVLRAAGEGPDALDAAGIDVRRVRWIATLVCGAAAGAGGVYLAIGYSHTFVEGMTAGRGFVALAIVVFARWNPWGGAAGALLIGLATSLQVRWQGNPWLGLEIPYQFFQMLPYALTLAVLAGTSRRGLRAPAALGRLSERRR
jgi:simple sugar transport system permease protein